MYKSNLDPPPKNNIIAVENVGALPLRLLVFDTLVPAGFPSPAGDFSENQIDLNELLIQHPWATYLSKRKGIHDWNWHLLQCAAHC